jgi:hypothetical protein
MNWENKNPITRAFLYGVFKIVFLLSLTVILVVTLGVLLWILM